MQTLKQAYNSIKDEWRTIACPCCYYIFHWIGVRLPNYCPECGEAIIKQLRQDKRRILHHNLNAVIRSVT